jgi:phenylalanine-4-hydroxylase
MDLQVGDLVLFYYEIDTAPGVVLEICLLENLCKVFWADFGVSVERMRDLKLITSEKYNGKLILDR